MNCSRCNCPIPDGAVFCPNCGAKRERQPVPAASVSNPQKPFLPVILLGALSLILAVAVIVLLITKNPGGNTDSTSEPFVSPLSADDIFFGGREDTSDDSEDTASTAAAANKMESGGYDTPQEAVRDYLEGMKNGDLGRMLGAFAIESYVDSYDFKAQLTRSKWYSSNFLMAPSVNEITRSLNLERRRTGITGLLMYQYMWLNMPDFDMNQNMPLRYEEDVEAFLSEMSKGLLANRAANIEEVSFPPLSDFLEDYGVLQGVDYSGSYYSEGNQDNISLNETMLGVSEIESVVAAFSIDGTEGYLCCDVGLYDGKWRIVNLSGNVGALLALPAYNVGLSPEFDNFDSYAGPETGGDDTSASPPAAG